MITLYILIFVIFAGHLQYVSSRIVLYGPWLFHPLVSQISSCRASNHHHSASILQSRHSVNTPTLKHNCMRHSASHTLLAKKVVTPRDDVYFLWLFLFHQSARSKDSLFGVIKCFLCIWCPIFLFCCVLSVLATFDDKMSNWPNVHT